MVRYIIIIFTFVFLLGETKAQRSKTTSSSKKTTVVSKKSTPKKSTSTKKVVPVKKTTTKKPTTQTSKSTTSKKTTSTKEATSISSLQSRKKALQNEIRQRETQLASTSKNVKKQLNDLAIINGKIDIQKKHIGEIQVELDSLSKNISQLKKEHELLSQQLADRKQRYRKAMIYMYQHNNKDNKLLFILSASNFSQMLRRYRYVSEYGSYQQKQGELIQLKQRELEELKKQLEQTQYNKNKKMSAQKAENEKLTNQQNERKKMVTSLQRKQKEISRVLATNKKEMASLDAKIDYYVRLAVEQERKRREAEERKAREAMEAEARKAGSKETQSKSNTSSSKTSDKKEVQTPKPEPMPQWKSSKEYTLTQNFTSNKGKLPMPITGSYVISGRYGNYNMSGLNGVQLSNKGVNITGQSGAMARCIFPGEVTAIFSLGGMVNVIVRHGSYISVYCNLSSASVRPEQKVEARSILGRIANDASGHCTLHFELRKETATLNPESWLAR